MSHAIEIYPLLSNEQSVECQLEVAEGVQWFVYKDLRRVGATESEAHSVADPNDDRQVADQLQRMLHPPVAGTRYLGVYADEEWRGIAKVGPWLHGDEGHYGRIRELVARYKQLMQPHEVLPFGLHALAVQQGLSRAALEAIYLNHVSANRSFQASVHEADDELQDAFTALGAPLHGPRAEIKLGNYAANYTLRSLPPRERNA